MKGRRQDEIAVSGKHTVWLATRICKEREPLWERWRKITRQHPSAIRGKRERTHCVWSLDQNSQGCTITGLPEPNGLIYTSGGPHRTTGMKGHRLHPILVAT